ncbi:hypothetical protein GCM10011332_18210 [Terasakiella brassicae]|uniref:GtrA/DPMS transmembrane domain-containing protein n=1 Tax=Terasakiella brassicae TaxID=1634917 RepID=A0A917C1M9_9PROT|nr:GtrA family protein [Terasakiella brassicae]GGF64467.1 hypothetical protein GCM10011332_18210 [Terasakiella brassicae]
MEKIKHYGHFLFAGASAFLVNTIILYVLSNVLGVHAYVGQIVGLWGSITASWWINRTKTFKTTAAPSWVEYRAYCGSMLLASLTNYICYIGVLAIYPVLEENPVIALFPATAVSMFVSYFGMKYFVFKK